ncbi:Rec102 [Kluyveromyces lactis]|nr:Rec102 [Kluyveromyces lactis]
MSKIDALYLSNKEGTVISEWNCEIFLHHSKQIHEDMIVIPFIITIKGLNGLQFDKIFQSFCRSGPFWEKLQYDSNFDLVSDSFLCELCCKQFGNMKRELLFDKPMSSKVHDPAAIEVESFDKVVIVANFHQNPTKSIDILDIINQCNEYVNSLFISQLEFKLPLVFSPGTRNRLKMHEGSIGLVSKCLDNSQTVTPSIVKIISNDKTSTTVFQILSETSKTRATLEKYKSTNNWNKLPQMFEGTDTD